MKSQSLLCVWGESCRTGRGKEGRHPGLEKHRESHLTLTVVVREDFLEGGMGMRGMVQAEEQQIRSFQGESTDDALEKQTNKRKLGMTGA